MKIGFMAILFIVFLVLKLTHVIAWSWIWITAPLWVAASIWVAIRIWVWRLMRG